MDPSEVHESVDSIIREFGQHFILIKIHGSPNPIIVHSPIARFRKTFLSILKR